ncbi:sigma-54 dependent transcriptional regulator [bacterium]|nr:sigma-54 dependent transcriptional regulator [bacterium]
MDNRILIVDDEGNIRNSLKIFLSDEGYSCIAAVNGQDALNIIQSDSIDLIITDLIMPEMDGMQLLERVRQQYKDIRVIMLTAYGTVESAVKAMKYGAVDFLLKPVDFDMLLAKVKDCFEIIDLKREVRWLKEQCSDAGCSNCISMVGESAGWKDVVRQTEKVAQSDITVLITGESGTGKEVLARAMHRFSERRDRPFVPVNCSGLPETLLESELFGVVKGAYSGAVKDREGLIRTAKDGTVFLDEISELLLSSQAKLLRVLQDGEVRPLGSDSSSVVSARFVAASNQNIKVMVEQGKFREDLYYRISPYVIHIPPLRDRWEDIPYLAKQFVYCYSAREGKSTPMLSSDAITHLQAYDWPGNVRQLENVIRSALLFHDGDYLFASDFPPEIFNIAEQSNHNGLKEVINRFEKTYIQRILHEQKGDKKTAAEKLHISLTTLYQKIKDLGILITDNS